MTLVSYVIPCFNGESYILECLESVFGQKGVNVEALVINDGSSDRSVDRIHQFMNSAPYAKVSLLSHPGNKNLGVSASRFLGVQQAQGEFIGFLDADDVLLAPNKTLEQISIFTSFPNVVLVHSGVKIIGDMSIEASAHEQHFVQRSVLGPYHLSKADKSLEVNCIANSTVLVRSRAIAKFSYSQLFQVEDFVQWHLVSLAGAFYCLPGALVGYRFHSGTATHRYSNSSLVQHYSSIEFKLALAAKSPSQIQSAVALLSLFSTLSNLLLLYSRDELLTRGPSPNWILRFTTLFARVTLRASCFAYRYLIS